MARKPMLLGATVAGLLVFAVLAAGLFLTRGPAVASPAAATPTAAAPQSAPAPAAPQDYATRLAQNFAARLGVDQARLDAAFTAAANDTVAQAVRDGKMDQNTADTARKMAARGLTGALQSALS